MSLLEIDQLRRSYDISTIVLCNRANVAPSTYSRWLRFVRDERGGTRPLVTTLDAVRRALREIVTERRERTKSRNSRAA